MLRDQSGGDGVQSGRIARGDWIVAGEVPPPTRKLDGWLRILTGEPRRFAHWRPVHLHLGAADVTGRVAMLQGHEIAAGASGLVQLMLDRSVAAVRGDRFVIRDQTAQRIIGGGRVIDLFPPAGGRARRNGWPIWPRRRSRMTAARWPHSWRPRQPGSTTPVSRRTGT